MYQSFFKNIESNINLSEKEKIVFSQFFKEKALKKKDFFLSFGAVAKYEAFIKKGCFRIFYRDISGKETNLYFATEGWWLSDIDSFINENPASLNIEALEDSVILQISKPDKEKLVKLVPKTETLFRIMSQKALIAMQRRMIDTLSKTADERYINLIKKYPKLEQRIAQHHIASYLGISPEFLSKIRHKLSKKIIS